MAKAGMTYRLFHEGKEVEHWHVVRVHGRRIYFGMTAYSSLTWRTTRLRWQKFLDAAKAEGLIVTEEPTP